MHSFLLNELSLHGQFTCLKEFTESLKLIIEEKQLISSNECTLYCDSAVRFRPVIGEMKFGDVIRESGQKELISSVLGWLSKTGPFWAVEQRHSSTDIFDYQGQDVTGTSVSEAACRHSADTSCMLLGFSSLRWNKTPLPILWLNEDGEKCVSLDNFWEKLPLENYLAAKAPPICSWTMLREWSATNCTNLLFSDDVIEPILAEPFSFAAAEEVKMLLLILDRMSACHTLGGALNAEGAALHAIYFQGHHARFSDEAYSSKFEFSHPTRKEKIICSWHGKIRLGRQYRIHFEWPKVGKLLWVSYIGPKLTKW